MGKNLIVCLIVNLITSFSLESQNILTIEINKLQNNKGHILLELLDENNKQVKGISQDINNNKCIITIKNLKSGKYSFKYFHDENNNKKLDTNWLGIPTEGFGFSNNARGTFGPPAFEKTVFDIKGSITKKCIPKYY